MTLRRSAEWLAEYYGRLKLSTPGAAIPGRGLPSATDASGTLQCAKADSGRVCRGHLIPDAAASSAPISTADPPNGNVGVGVPRAGARSAVVPYERDVLAAVLELLATHPTVAWAQRMNVGAFENAAGKHVRVGFVGCSDVIGQMKDGRFLAIEVKRPGGKPTADQVAFLGRVDRAGGVAFVAWSVDDVMRGLA